MFKAGSECIVWLDDLSVTFNRGLRPAELSEIRLLITERRTEIVARWLEQERQQSLGLVHRQLPPAVFEMNLADAELIFRLEDGCNLTVPPVYYPSLARVTPEERARHEIHGNAVYWPEPEVDFGHEGLLAGAREPHTYARQTVERAGRLRPAITPPPATRPGVTLATTAAAERG